MATILFLNGCGSSGKTTLARAIQNSSKTPWLYFGVDSLIDMAPEKFMGLGEYAQEGYFSFHADENSHGKTQRVTLGPLAPQLFDLGPDFVRLLADRGNDVIVDEVLLNDDAFYPYAHALRNHNLVFIGVQCDLVELQRREMQRQDRLVGLANDQIDRVHHGFRPYDLIIDTTHTSPQDGSRKILTFLTSHRKKQ